MAALTSPSSPSSFQLRVGLGTRKSSSVLLRIRFCASDRSRRMRLVSSAAGAAAREGGEGRDSWTNSEASSDSFSGWFGPESDGGSEKKGGFGGIIGAGLAGIFFAAGVTFASVSLSSKRTSGFKEKLQPLTAQQEVLPTVDDQNEKIDLVENESNVELSPAGNVHDDSTPDIRTGTNKDYSSSIETNESTSESRLDANVCVDTSIIQNNKSAGDGVDAIQKPPSQEVLQVSTVDHISAPTSSNASSTELPEYDKVDSSSDTPSFEGSHSNMPFGMPDSLVGLGENLGAANLVDSTAFGTDSANFNNDREEEIFTSTENFKLPLNSGGSIDHLPSEPLTSGSISLQSNETLNSLADSVDVVETVDCVSREKDLELGPPLAHSINENVLSRTISASKFDQSEIPQLPCEIINSPVDEHKLEENCPSEVPLASITPQIYELDANVQSETNRSRSLFDSLLPENSYSYAGIPAPSLVSAAQQVHLGKVLVPAVVDQVQGQALAALQVLKVIEANVQPGDICTRREYARWLVSASSALSRNTASKVYPAMFIENVTELAFDDVTPEDLDFPFVQGLAEAGLIASKLSRSDMNVSVVEKHDIMLFSPESPLSRQDLVSWKMALEKGQLPEVDRKTLYQHSGYIDIDRINPDAWPALAADLSTGEHGIIPLAFGYTRLFQPDKPVTKAQAAVALATGDFAEVVGEELTRLEAESLAESAVAAHTALVAQVEKDLNASFEKELSMEREKIDAVEKLAEEARLELERLRNEREEENNALIRGRATVESEMEVLSRLRQEVEEQLQSLMGNKMAITFERERINKLRKEAESDNQVLVQLQHELEVERKALSMARAWAEDEAKRAREQAKALEEARDRWERHGIKVIVDEDLRDDASVGTTWHNAGKHSIVEGTINRAENLMAKLKAMSVDLKGKSATVIGEIIQKIMSLISALKQRILEASLQATELKSAIVSRASKSVQEFRENTSRVGLGLSDGATRVVEDCKEGVEKITQNASGFGLGFRDGARRVVEDCKEGVEKITQKFKT